MREIQHFLTHMNLNASASDREIEELEAALGRQLPPDYTEFLRIGNGGEGFIGDAVYAILWRCGELIEINEAYQVQQRAPGLLAFGSDGGGEGFGFDTRQIVWPVVQVPWIGMDWTTAIPLGESFTRFLKTLYGTR